MANPAATNELSEAAKALRGEMFYAFTPELLSQWKRCTHACHRFNNAGEAPSRRKLVQLWRDIINDKTPLPQPASTPEEDDALFEEDPYVMSPVRIDYGTNIRCGTSVFINSSATFIDTCLISIGSRTMFGPNVSLYSGTHPLDPFLRNGIKGPEMGKPITIGEDCWLGGNVTICPGVTLGRGVTVGAGSVVTKSFGDFLCIAGNPAKVIKKIEVNAPDPKLIQTMGAEGPMREQAEKLEEKDVL